MSRQPSKYFWPASALSASDMDLLYRAREASSPRIPITQLIAQTVRYTCGQRHISTVSMEAHTQPNERKKAA